MSLFFQRVLRQAFWFRRLRIALGLILTGGSMKDLNVSLVDWVELKELSKKPLGVARALKYVFTGNVDDLTG